jgi:Phosphatidylinositol 3- and 4-kinase
MSVRVPSRFIFFALVFVLLATSSQSYGYGAIDGKLSLSRTVQCFLWQLFPKAPKSRTQTDDEQQIRPADSKVSTATKPAEPYTSETFTSFVKTAAASNNLTLGDKITDGQYSPRWVLFKGHRIGIFKASDSVLDPKVLENSPEAISPTKAVEREVASTIVDEGLGYSLVPPTMEINIDGHHGSIQMVLGNEFKTYWELWLQDTTQSRYHMPGEAKIEDIYNVNEYELTKLAVLDLISGARDRTFSNWMTTLQGDRIAAIDNGNTFPTQRHLLQGRVQETRRITWVLGSQMDRPLPLKIQESVQKLDVEGIAKKLQEQLHFEPEAIALFRERVALIRQLISANPKITLRAIVDDFEKRGL